MDTRKIPQSTVALFICVCVCVCVCVSVCVCVCMCVYSFLSYPVQSASTVCIVVYGLSASTILLSTHAFDFLYKVLLKYFSFSAELDEILSQMYTFLGIKYPLFLSDFNQLEFSRKIFEKSSYVKFH